MAKYRIPGLIVSEYTITVPDKTSDFLCDWCETRTAILFNPIANGTNECLECYIENVKDNHRLGCNILGEDAPNGITYGPPKWHYKSPKK